MGSRVCECQAAVCARLALECWHLPIPGVDPGLLGVLTKKAKGRSTEQQTLCVCVCVFLLKQVLLPAVGCVGMAGAKEGPMDLWQSWAWISSWYSAHPPSPQVWETMGKNSKSRMKPSLLAPPAGCSLLALYWIWRTWYFIFPKGCVDLRSCPGEESHCPDTQKAAQPWCLSLRCFLVV